MDFSAAGLARAARLAAERGVSVDWVLADLLDYRPAPGSCGLVLIAYIHLPAASLARVFRAAAAAVAPGGTLLVIGHDRDNITRGHGGPQDPDRLYTPAEVTAELDGLASGARNRSCGPCGRLRASGPQSTPWSGLSARHNPARLTPAWLRLAGRARAGARIRPATGGAATGPCRGTPGWRAAGRRAAAGSC